MSYCKDDYIDSLEKRLHELENKIKCLKSDTCWFCEDSKLINKTKDGDHFITLMTSNEDWRRYKQIITYCPICGRRL